MNVRNEFLQHGEIYQVIRGGEEVHKVKASKNRKKAENRKYLMLSLEADVRAGDWLVGTLSEQEFFIEEVEKSVFFGTLDGLDAYYLTKREHADKYPATASKMPTQPDGEVSYDAIVSHASEDKKDFVDELAKRLKERGFRIWYDSDNLTWGESTRQGIDLGVLKSKKGIVVLSEAFFRKRWTGYELDGLVQRHVAEGGVILPIYHGIDNQYVRTRAPSLGDITALSSNLDIDQIVEALGGVLGRDTSEMMPVVGVPTKAAQCRNPRLVIGGSTPEERIYHLSPRHVETRDINSGVGFYAPYPYRIAGLSQENVYLATERREMLMLRGLPPRALTSEGDLWQYQFLRRVPPHEEDEPCA